DVLPAGSRRHLAVAAEAEAPALEGTSPFKGDQKGRSRSAVAQEEGDAVLQRRDARGDAAGGDPSGSLDLVDHPGRVGHVARRGPQAPERRRSRAGVVAAACVGRCRRGGRAAPAPQGPQLGSCGADVPASVSWKHVLSLSAPPGVSYEMSIVSPIAPSKG